MRELFEQAAPNAPRKTRGEIMRFVDADYYGYMDEDDGLLLPAEQARPAYLSFLIGRARRAQRTRPIRRLDVEHSWGASPFTGTFLQSI